MNFLRTAITLLILCSQSSLAMAEEATSSPVGSVESRPVTLDEAIKQVLQDGKTKVLGAKTEVENGKKIHVIKVLTATGHIQYIRIDAATGKTLAKARK
jgi:uncharacterized membrane protein YkoI